MNPTRMVISNGVTRLEYLTESELADLSAPAIVIVPDIVTNFQARAVMMATPAGEGTLFDLVDAWAKASGGIALQAWEYANTVNRKGALVISAAAEFGLTQEQIDALFIAASRIEA